MQQNTFTFVAYAPVFVLCANPLKEVVDVSTIRAIKQMSSFNLFIFSFFSLKLKIEKTNDTDQVDVSLRFYETSSQEDERL